MTLSDVEMRVASSYFRIRIKRSQFVYPLTTVKRRYAKTDQIRYGKPSEGVGGFLRGQAPLHPMGGIDVKKRFLRFLFRARFYVF